ncbi:MAG TPA: hypothetical protein VK308_10170 [Pyrinomonadaceae bacterium]|nr:hypothetical protein [Pyrinomonadaceae bacterium]
MPLLVGIDGTGSAVSPGEQRDRDYDVAFANSFVSRLCKPNTRNKRYFRGPVALGGGLVNAINEGFNFLQERHRQNPGEPILLTGYSRGAAGVVSLAGRLQRAGISVRAMLLFDCVDRHMFIDAEVIPNNVGHVMHVVRDARSGSRESFSNDGLKYRPPTVYPQAYAFMCTHGGMGGTPWDSTGHSANEFINEGGVDGRTNITYGDDARVSEQVWAFVQPFINTHGFRL